MLSPLNLREINSFDILVLLLCVYDLSLHCLLLMSFTVSTPIH